MIYEALAFDSASLLSLPETGMGYQIIEAKLEGGSIRKRFVVYNEKLIIDLDSNFDQYKKTIIAKGFSNVLNQAPHLSFERNSIRLITKNLVAEMTFMSEYKKSIQHRYSGGKGAIDNPKEMATGSETFVRISAYEADKRIDLINKKLVAGSYTTTLADYSDCVKYQDDPIDRYALPNDELIKWAFYILPKQNDILQRGIVQPAFKHDGGGLEAYFENGTSNNTFLEKRAYGK